MHCLRLVLPLAVLPAALPAAAQSASPYSAWKNGPPTDESFFPVAVRLQDPRNAKRYKELGINTYVGLWKGPTEQQLSTLRDAGLYVVCSQNEVGRKNRDSKTIIAWMHGDEPDNAQSLPGGKGYGPPILPSKIISDYERIKNVDPARPVLLNLGQGVAYDNYIGRGVRRNKPEDYPEYVKGCDIASFDIYPANHDKPEVAGKLWFVPRGVDRLHAAGGGKKVVWNCIECTPIGEGGKRPTPAQVRTEVWMSLIHGSRGLIYFCHVFRPKFIEAGPLADDEMAEAMTAINRQIHELAPVLNAPTVADGATVSTGNAAAPVDILVKRRDGATYVFAVAMRDAAARAAFTVAGIKGKTAVEVIGESRRLEAVDGRFEDDFAGYAVHLYRIGGK
jgi:hypothetical protein